MSSCRFSKKWTKEFAFFDLKSCYVVVKCRSFFFFWRIYFFIKSDLMLSKLTDLYKWVISTVTDFGKSRNPQTWEENFNYDFRAWFWYPRTQRDLTQNKNPWKFKCNFFLRIFCNNDICIALGKTQSKYTRSLLSNILAVKM